MSDIIQGFEPFFDANSEVLILGSFPSVKSRAVSFYYGNRQNRFWKMLFGYFGEPCDDRVEIKKDFLLRRHVALWDIVQNCRIRGSADAQIRDYTVAYVGVVLQASRVRLILLNGKRAFEIFEQRYADLGVPYRLMPSTSPANTRYDESVWRAALDAVFVRRPDPTAEGVRSR